MTDKILKEAFDKLTAIEEDESGSDYYSEKRQKRKDNAPDELDEDRDDDMDGIEELTDIQDQLFEIIERLDSAIRAYVPSKHAYWQSYGLAQLKIAAGSDEYATQDESINNLIAYLKDSLGSDDEGFRD